MKTRRKLNWKFALLLSGVAVVSSVGFWLVHRFQVKRTASYQLVLADRAEQANELEKASEALERYLQFRRAEVDVEARYGNLQAKLAKTYNQ